MANTAVVDDAVLEAFKAALLSMDGSRVCNLLDDCRQRHGRQARETAFLTCHRWREGKPTYWDATAARLFDLLPYHLSEWEKLSLICRLRAEALEQTKSAPVRVMLSSSSDLAAVVSRILPQLRRIESMGLPAPSPRLRLWLSDTSTVSLDRIAEETSRLLAAQRLADLIVRLTLLYRLRALTGPGIQIRVIASFVIPTATVILQFRQSFWKEKPMNENTELDQDFLVRLQDLALAQEWQKRRTGLCGFCHADLDPVRAGKAAGGRDCRRDQN